MKEEQKLVTVIVPIYNVEKYVQTCVKSICEQSYSRLEIILVDDGSTDESGVICDLLQSKDNRISVIHQKNYGLSEARNSGIRKANGEYLFFVDGDDAIDKNCIQELYENCIKYNADIAITDGIMFEDSLPFVKINDSKCELWSPKECMKNMLIARQCGHSSWGKLFKAKLWEGEEFPKGKLYEDYATTYKIVGKSKIIVNLDDNMYFYRKRSGSIMNSNINEKKLTIISISEEVTNYLCEYSERLREYAVYRQMVIYMKALDEILDYDMKAFQSYQDVIINKIKKNKDIFKKPYVRKKDYIKANMLLTNKFLFMAIYKCGKWYNFLKFKVKDIINKNNKRK